MTVNRINSLSKTIAKLEMYIKMKSNSTNSSIKDMLEELKLIEEKLSTDKLVGYLVEMYRDGMSIEDISKDINKTKKIFKLANLHIISLENDKIIQSLIEKINYIIRIRLENALTIYKDEFYT